MTHLYEFWLYLCVLLYMWGLKTCEHDSRGGLRGELFRGRLDLFHSAHKRLYFYQQHQHQVVIWKVDVWSNSTVSCWQPVEPVARSVVLTWPSCLQAGLWSLSSSASEAAGDSKSRTNIQSDEPKQHSHQSKVVQHQLLHVRITSRLLGPFYFNTLSIWGQSWRLPFFVGIMEANQVSQPY